MFREKVSEQILRLREQVMGRKGSWVHDTNPFERDLALYRTEKDLSVVQTRAALLREVVKIASIRIYPDWRLAGEHLPQGFGIPDLKNLEHLQKLEKLGISGTEAQDLVKVNQRWHDRTQLYYSIGKVNDDQKKGLTVDWGNPSIFMAGGWVENHSIRDYAKVLKYGFRGIYREIEAQMSAAAITDADFPQKENFWKAGLMVCEAGVLLGHRYAQLAHSMGNEDMANVCDRVPAEGAKTLFEAAQSLWFAHILTCGEDSINANSIGRLDQILFPYYDADIKAGRITRNQAVEVMEELACKMYLEYDVQAITLGGVDSDGQNAVNEMSYIILEATENVDFIRDVSVRINPKTPKEFIDRCAELVLRGGGIPFFFNDDCFIKALSDRGISEEHARDYAPIGCIELTIPGKASPHAVSGWISAAKCLELALFNGDDPRTGETLGPRTGHLSDFSTYEELLSAFKSQLDFFTRNMVYTINRGELAQREKGPLPCWSVLTDDCIKRGRDITDGGPIYNYHSICFLGTANVADSLIALKKLLFEEKTVSCEELVAALKSDFAGFEPLRQKLLKGAPKYGNDIPEVDQIAVWLTNYYIDRLDQYRTPLNGRFFVHLFSFLMNINFGKSLGATPDGRKAGEPLAYSLSANQGRDEKGVTALINTLSKLPHNRAGGASAAIIDLDPKLVAGETGLERLSQIIRTAITMGVGQMQFNVVTAERLRKAQECPEKYGNIPVRVAGYSQMFKLLSKELQEHVIARTKHSN